VNSMQTSEWKLKCEKLGVEYMRQILSSQFPLHGTMRVPLLPDETKNPLSAEVLAWVNEKDAAREAKSARLACWVKAATIFAFAATVMSLLAWLFPISLR
jgi:hypothetical protein